MQEDNEKLEQKQTSLQSDNQTLKQMQDKLRKDNAQLEIQQEKLRSSIDQMVQSEKLMFENMMKNLNGNFQSRERLQVQSHFGIK